MDHFFGIEQGFGAVDSPMLEGYITPPYLAAVINKIKLGLMLTGAFYRVGRIYEDVEMCSGLAGIVVHHAVFNMINEHEITPY